MTPSFFPSTVVVEPTNKCNLACEFCEASCTVNPHRPRHDLKPIELEVMLERLGKYVLNVVFQGDCEPTLNRRLPELARIASRYTSSIAVVTNGTQLREDYLRQLIDGGINWFAISIDDHRPEVFNKVRVNADLDQITRNLRRLIEIRDTEHPELHVVVHKIVFPTDTIDDIKAFVRTFYVQHRVNQITFAPLVVATDVKTKNWLAMRNQVESELMQEGVFINMRDFANYPYKTLHKFCGAHVLFIDHKGNLNPCALHAGGNRHMGNLLRESLDDIAANPQVKEFHDFWHRKQYANQLPTLCDGCFLLKGYYHRYTLNEGHEAGLQFVRRTAVAAVGE
jgi:radical SAM protein with 4Fe4S-binding SPASM domain